MGGGKRAGQGQEGWPQSQAAGFTPSSHTCFPEGTLRPRAADASSHCHLTLLAIHSARNTWPFPPWRKSGSQAGPMSPDPRPPSPTHRAASRGLPHEASGGSWTLSEPYRGPGSLSAQHGERRAGSPPSLFGMAHGSSRRCIHKPGLPGAPSSLTNLKLLHSRRAPHRPATTPGAR